MDFAALISFLTLYYIRPHEWIGWIQILRPVTLVMILAIVAIFSREGGFSRRALFQTPHDKLIFLFCLWMLVFSSDKIRVFHEVYAYYLSYAVAIQALDSIERIRKFLLWWGIMIFVMSCLAVLSEYGFDPTGSYDLTHGRMKERLVFNTSLFNNPNALGHSVVPVVLMLYFLLVWKRPVFSRMGAIILIAIPLYCIYLTQSKGSFISAFVSAVVAFTFGRPKLVQGLVIFVALTIGWAAIKTLPRMNEIEKTKTDQAIQGRVAAWRFGLGKIQTYPTSTFGIGKGDFVMEMRHATGIWKSSHSSYVQIGTEMGVPGFFIFFGIVYCCLRTLYSARTRNTAEERVRRILFSMVIPYLVSSWMVDFAYRSYFFLVVAAIGAFHRLLLKKESETTEDQQTTQEALGSITIKGLGPTPAIATPVSMSQTIAQTTITIPAASTAHGTEESMDAPGITWNRFGWMDAAFAAAMTYAAIQVWHYGVKNV